MIALSLLFAVFMSNPAPICVLDEVDAPLDDTNVDRFCGLVEQIAPRPRQTLNSELKSTASQKKEPRGFSSTFGDVDTLSVRPGQSLEFVHIERGSEVCRASVAHGCWIAQASRELARRWWRNDGHRVWV